MTTTTDLEAQKQTMRVQARATRRAVPADLREEAANKVAHMDLGILDDEPGVLGVYYPVRSEFDCLPLARRLANEGWQLALPVIVPGGPLEYHKWNMGAPVTTGPFGIPQPADGETITPTHLMIPLLAFDRRCYRLGYGGGNYDRTLADLRRKGHVVAIGLAFESQEVPDVPACPYDEQLDWILTASGPIRALSGEVDTGSPLGGREKIEG